MISLRCIKATLAINSASVHSRPIVERVLQLNAAAIILAHNHPSGVSDASQQDVAVTNRLRQALDLVDIQLPDHLVISDKERVETPVRSF